MSSVGHDAAAPSEPVIAQAPESLAQRRLERQAYVRRLQGCRPSKSLARLPFVALGVDLITVSAVLVIAGLGRAQAEHVGLAAPGLTSQVAVAAPVIAAGWILSIALAGGYQEKLFGAGVDEFRRVTAASIATVALVGIGSFLAKFDLSRGFYVLTLVLGPTFLLAGRVLLRYAVSRARARGALTSRALIVGTELHVDEVAEVLSRETWLGYEVVGALTPGSTALADTSSGVPVLGASEDAVSIAKSVHAEVVLFAGGAVESGAELRQLAWDLEHSDCEVIVAPSLTEVSRERVTVRPVGGLPLLHLEKPRAALSVRWGKRTFDFLGSLVLLLLLSPILLFAAFRIWRFDGGPILFRHTRIGRDGDPFGCWKFRTMVVDAEARLNEVLREQGLEHDMFAKLKEDPRITGPGHWLRRLSVDELPQLLNVLGGQMSLVGPRPQVEQEVALYDDATTRRLHVRPGMTGLWQVSGRSDLSVEEAIRLDLYYVDNWSMVQDLGILARTLNAVIGSRGAY